SSTVSLVNARVVVNGSIHSSVRFSNRILDIDSAPQRSDLVVDLEGSFVLPGLVNAHDHLELNHFGRVKGRETYENASHWIDDMRPKIREDEALREGQRHPLPDRLLVGALKNLLSGVTTVSHHNPFYRGLGASFPIRVVQRYGWAHSFFLEGKPVGAAGERGPAVARAYRKTSRERPFLIHLAEGYDESARSELSRLREQGCLRANTVLVHGVGLSPDDWPVVRRAGAGLVWCPSSNQFLLGRSAPVDAFLERDPGSRDSIALGTDSRLTGARDLLEELREARKAARFAPSDLLRMVTTNGARLLRARDAGRLSPGLPADLVVVPAIADEAGEALLACERSALGLVVIGGCPLVGAPRLSRLFVARGAAGVPAMLDGRERLLDGSLARRLRAMRLEEPGLAV
ncbi:MAG TPA: amidohydrolase family protein, partial [Vicinamibacteria bacterium]